MINKRPGSTLFVDTGLPSELQTFTNKKTTKPELYPVINFLRAQTSKSFQAMIKGSLRHYVRDTAFQKQTLSITHIRNIRTPSQMD
jgi:hypothetical protein